MSGGSPAPDGPTAAELADLRQRLAWLEQPGRRLKSVLAALLITLACVLTPLGTAAIWVKSHITDTDRYVATMAPLASDPAVQAAVTDRVTTELVSLIPISSLVGQLAPDDRPLLNALLGQVGGALTDGLTGFVQGQVASVVSSDAFATLWIQLNRSAHATLDKALTGQGGGAVQIHGNVVTLDLAPVIDQVKSRLVTGGLSIAGQLPTVHTDFVLADSQSVSTIRTVLRLLELAGFWVPVLALLCAAAGVLLAVRRRRALVTVALGMAAGAAVLGIGLSFFHAFYLDKLPAAVDQAAASAIYNTLVRFLRAEVRTVIVLGVLTALGAWLTGPGRRAVAGRGLWRAGLGAVRQSAQRLGLRLGPVGRFTHRFKAALGWFALAVVVVLFVTWNYPTALVVFWLAVVLVAVLAVLEFLDDPGPPSGAAPTGRPPGYPTASPPSAGTMPLR
ncbi:hypothetical protein P3T36_003306 [Kitasatospora sp. MAP12-15]|uniref:hypothetical protein n=1 Tax=unclassified Kitasatospora TaxID=2633591 RepID=UPI0024747729|nr:hypothetical protein [Kitasatospora sp. MAP12-44]MDH6111282.1 hypothetical protein [Kitasatospora sp. MAP12-44]